MLVLDEPTVGQDPVLREELWNALRARADAGVDRLVSSHVMDEANRCDHLLLIRDGRSARRRHTGGRQGLRRHDGPGRRVPDVDPPRSVEVAA